MTIHVHATYRAGAIYPDQPLGLPENTEVQVTIIPVANPAGHPTGEEPDIVPFRPKSPKITPEEFRALVDKYSVSVGTLPPDFSREDIYSDHD
jgi:hypothetical protein